MKLYIFFGLGRSAQIAQVGNLLANRRPSGLRWIIFSEKGWRSNRLARLLKLMEEGVKGSKRGGLLRIKIIKIFLPPRILDKDTDFSLRSNVRLPLQACHSKKTVSLSGMGRNRSSPIWETCHHYR